MISSVNDDGQTYEVRVVLGESRRQVSELNPKANRRICSELINHPSPGHHDSSSGLRRSVAAVQNVCIDHMVRNMAEQFLYGADVLSGF